jgi:hypothetical protein
MENENDSIEKKFSNEEYEIDYQLKTQGLENILGTMFNIVGHAIIPFEIGGSVDMYYFNEHLNGTGFATMELIEPDGTGPIPNDYGTYELVAFTKEHYDNNELSSFNKIERKICGIFTSIGHYSREVILNPKDTIEIPSEDGESSYLVLDNYQPEGKVFMIGDKNHHLLLCVQIFKSEMEFARQNGSEKLFSLLKNQGFYPFSDLDRPSVA